jgi:hypothetical protein
VALIARLIGWRSGIPDDPDVTIERAAVQFVFDELLDFVRFAAVPCTSSNVRDCRDQDLGNLQDPELHNCDL